VCNNVECAQSEACRKTGPTQVCGCNGGAACAAGQVCCQVGGCKDLNSDPQNCGVCGRACAAGSSCVSGACS
jgi:hypothetical protein